MGQSNFAVLLPEVTLALYAMVALLFGVWFGKDRLTRVITIVTALVLVAIAYVVATRTGLGAIGWDGMVIDDAFARFAKVVALLGAAGVLLVGEPYMHRNNADRFEYPILIALAAVGMMVMLSATDLMALYMGLELQSLALYVVASMRRESVRSTEAGLKYFVLGALSSGLLLYGASLVYGFAGTTTFGGIATAISGQEHLPLGLLFGLVFVLTGLAFKVSAVPFHMWTPDVYEGSPTPVTAFFATAPKVAAMGLLARVLFDAFGSVAFDWQQIVAFLSVASMALGAIAGVGQRDIKRLMAYSSIAHMGFALIGIAAGGEAGLKAALLYMAIYVTMNLGAFAFILSMTRGGKAVTDIASLSLYSRSEPLAALALLVVFFSLAGVPPMLGFFAKFSVLDAAVAANMTWLAVAGVIASVVGAYYYIRIVYVMYFGAEDNTLDRTMAPVEWAFLVIFAVVQIAGVVNLLGLEAPALAAAQALVQ